MDETIRKLLDKIPERQPRSKLEPHIDVIRELRRKRRSYQEISVFFKEHLKIPVAPSTLYEFVKSRARPARKPVVELPDVEASRAAEFQAGKLLETGSGSGIAAGPARCGRDDAQRSRAAFGASQRAAWFPV